jgi:hypothetical protein
MLPGQNRTGQDRTRSSSDAMTMALTFLTALLPYPAASCMSPRGLLAQRGAGASQTTCALHAYASGSGQINSSRHCKCKLVENREAMLLARLFLSAWIKMWVEVCTDLEKHPSITGRSDRESAEHAVHACTDTRLGVQSLSDLPRLCACT